MEMATAMIGSRDRSPADILAWWLILAIFAAAAWLLPASRANAQQTGPLPAATPSDAPPPPPRASAPKRIGDKPNLSGTWALNKDDSDDPRQAMQEAGGGNRGSGNGNGGNAGPRIGVGGPGGGMGGGGGWGGRGGGGGNGGGNGGGGRRGQNGENPASDLSQLTIAQTATSATVASESGRVLAQYSADARSQTTPTMKNSTPNSASTPSSPPAAGSASPSSSGDSSSDGDSANAPPTAQWQGSQLIAVTPGRRQGATTRTYELSPDGQQLYVTTKIDNPRFQSPVTFRLVYDPVPSSE
jgi:hypothetical protein